MELLLQLSFCFPAKSEWCSAVAQQCPDLNQVLLAVKDLPPGRSLDVHAMLSLKHIQASLEQSPATQVVQQQVAPGSCLRCLPPPNSVQKHNRQAVIIISRSLRRGPSC
jgi:hypothetical protein